MYFTSSLINIWHRLSLTTWKTSFKWLLGHYVHWLPSQWPCFLHLFRHASPLDLCSQSATASPLRALPFILSTHSPCDLIQWAPCTTNVLTTSWHISSNLTSSLIFRLVQSAYSLSPLRCLIYIVPVKNAFCLEWQEAWLTWQTYLCHSIQDRYCRSMVTLGTHFPSIFQSHHLYGPYFFLIIMDGFCNISLLSAFQEESEKTKKDRGKTAFSSGG